MGCVHPSAVSIRANDDGDGCLHHAMKVGIFAMYGGNCSGGAAMRLSGGASSPRAQAVAERGHSQEGMN